MLVRPLGQKKFALLCAVMALTLCRHGLVAKTF